MSLVIGARKVGTSEFAKVIYGGAVVCACCSYLSSVRIWETSKDQSFLHHCNGSTNDIVGGVKRNSTVPASVTFVHGTVRHVLRATADAKISSSVIKRLKILMVDVLAFRTPHYLAVHPYNTTTFFSSGIEPLGVIVPNSEPYPPHEPFVVFGINDGPLILCKWYKAVEYILRLGHLFQQVAHIFSPERGGAAPFYFSTLEVACGLL